MKFSVGSMEHRILPEENYWSALSHCIIRYAQSIFRCQLLWSPRGFVDISSIFSFIVVILPTCLEANKQTNKS